MNFSWVEIKKSLQKFWNKLSRPQKIIIVAAPLLIASTLIILMVWASRPQYVSIFTNLSDTDAGAITTKLKDLKLDYRLADNGGSIQVPQQQAAAVRLQLANAGLPGTSKFSFDYLDQMHLGETDADKKLRYVLGLQNELETTLKSLSSVADARVHIVMPEPSLFAEKEKSTTAGVTLKLVPGTKIAEDQVRAIAKLMASSIEGLTMENVTIVDTSGNTLSDILSQSRMQERLSGTQIQLQQTVEENIRKSIQSMLDRVFPGKTVVRANVVLDFDQIKITEQKNGPGAVLSKQSTSENATNATPSGTVPGTTNNVPSYPSPTSSGTTSSTNKATNTENYQVDTRQEERVVSPGAIKRLSISVMADVTQTQVDQIQSIVASAAGIDQARGDQIQVAAIPFDKTGLQEEKNAFAQAELRRQVLLYAEYGAVLLLGLIFLLIFWRSRVRRRRAELAFETELRAVPLAAEAEEILLAQEEDNLKLEKPLKSADEQERQKIRQAVQEYARKSPDEVARLLKAWLTEER
ncbi:MAG: flagellar basal-body MS-ring/collar protein FliF [Desulfitobacteriaceae bacterium]